jgi:2,3-bisphosphoglycerate-dependent phosphoglycerate mutase
MTGRLLVLLRHGESEWNRSNRFTGSTDVDLTETGIAQARAAGRALKAQGITFAVGFSSALRRTKHSLALVLDEMGQAGIPTVSEPALNERDYGELTGLDKDEALRRWGGEQVQLWRRSYDVAPPGGESLKDTAARVLPFYREAILPRVLRGEPVLVVAHEHSLRAIVMTLEQLDSQAILKRELTTAAPLVYRLNADSTAASKLDLAEGGVTLAAQS